MISLIEYINKQSSIKKTSNRKWEQYAIDTLPYLIDCIFQKRTISYSELGTLLFKNGITQCLYANSSAATHIGKIIGIIGEYCIKSKCPPINTLVTHKSNNQCGHGVDSFIRTFYKEKTITPQFIKEKIYPEIFSFNWNSFCEINDINPKQPFAKIALLPSEAEDQEFEEQRLLRQHLKNESIGRLQTNDIKKIKTIKAQQIGKYKCEVCGFDFSEHYKNIGQNFIELHHLAMYKNMKNNSSRKLNAHDFALLCSNCHRMIHKLPNPQNNLNDIKTLKKLYK